MTVMIELNLPAESVRLRLPQAVALRLQNLLDRQDAGDPLSPQERDEAQGLVDVAEFLALLRLRAERVHDIVSATPKLKELGLDRLPAEDRLAVAEAIWDNVVLELESAPLPETQRRALERRLADSIARPDAVACWEVIKARTIARARRDES